MTPQTRKRLIIGGIGAVVLMLLIFAFIPDEVPVETAEVTRAPMRVIVEEEGRTEVANRFAVTAPVSGYLRRVQLEVGDAVQRGAAIARIEAPRTPLIDPSTRAEAAARLRAAQATAQAAIAERDRIQRLVTGGSATRQALEQANTEVTRTAAEVAAAQAALRAIEPGTAQAAHTIEAPASGRILAVKRVSEGAVNPGDTIVVIGNANTLEIRAEVLSQDAVRMQPGTRVIVTDWGGGTDLEAAVRRIEPQAFTRVSSLGVEEQRVVVIATLTSRPELWPNLGAGYRVVAHFVLWEEPDVLQVPSAALFRAGDGWAAFVVNEGRAQRREVTIGRQAGLATQVLSGLEAGQEVIVHPSNEIADGVRVAPR